MLDKFRNIADTIFIKIIIGMIILSFVLLGIGDLFQKRLSSHVAKIGNTKITDQHLDQQVLRLESQYKEQNLDKKTLKQIALQNIITDTLIASESKNLNYITNNKISFSIIKDDPNFQDENGNFNEKKFKNFLASRNLSEKQIF